MRAFNRTKSFTLFTQEVDSVGFFKMLLLLFGCCSQTRFCLFNWFVSCFHFIFLGARIDQRSCDNYYNYRYALSSFCFGQQSHFFAFELFMSHFYALVAAYKMGAFHYVEKLGISQCNRCKSSQQRDGKGKERERKRVGGEKRRRKEKKGEKERNERNQSIKQWFRAYH